MAKKSMADRLRTESESLLDVHLPFCAKPVWKRTLGSGSSFGEGGSMDPKTLDPEQALDEAFENIVLLESTEPDDDVVPGEFDIY